MTAEVQDQASRIGEGPFEQPEHPFRANVLYSRTWRAPLVHGLTDIWRDRCRQYWERVERRFGVVFSERRDAYEPLSETVTTMATVLLVLPGKRYKRRPSEAAH